MGSERPLDLFADRTSTHWMASNQLRLWFSAFAHLIMSTLQAEVLKGTELASASIGQVRLRLCKVAAQDFVFVEAPKINAIPARHYWDPEYRKRVLPKSVVADNRPGASRDNVSWAGNQIEVNIFIFGYDGCS